MGMVAQALAAWWWFKVSSHEFSGEVPNAAKKLREIGRLNARAAIAQSIASTAAIVLWLTGADSVGVVRVGRFRLKPQN
jgi:hypothetical protein